MAFAVSIERIFEVASLTGASEEQPTEEESLKSKKKKKSKLEGKRIFRKTDKGFFESNAENGKISADKAIKFKKKDSAVSKEVLLAENPGIAREDIVAVKDMFILRFQDYKDEEGMIVQINMDDAVTAYGALPIVISAVRN